MPDVSLCSLNSQYFAYIRHSVFIRRMTVVFCIRPNGIHYV